MTNEAERRVRWMQVRIGLLAGLLVFGGALVARRAWELQVQRSGTLREMAEDQYLRNVRLSPKRGAVLDRHGAELAVSVGVDSVYANPREMKKKKVSTAHAASVLAPILGVNARALYQRFEDDRYFVWVKRQITPNQAALVRKLGIEGVELTKEARRFYPNRELAAHVLGFANIDGKGIEGMELALDDRLRGSAALVPAIRDRRGRIVFSESLFDDRSSLGDDVMLTLDKSIQAIAERELELAVRTFEAQAGSVVVMDPRNGEILALANFPTFNPNDPGQFPGSYRRNRAVTDRYEPGSTIKPFTIAGALAKGSVRPNQLIDCGNGEMQVAEYTIHDTHQWEDLTPAQVLAQSSNVGAAKIGASLGKEGLYRVLRGFGFGSKTEVMLPGETNGILRHYSRWYDMDAATIAFGQGLSVNTLQMAVAMSAIANGGNLVKPVIVQKVVHPDGTSETIDPVEVRRRVLPVGTARLVADMMTEVTAPGGTGAEAAVDGYLVAGKTGTAQKADYIGGGYAKGKWIASFVGFAPARDAKLVIAIAIDEPVIAHHGGTVAAPVFRRIAEATLRHMGISPRGSAHSLTLAKTKPAKKAAREEASLEVPVVLEAGAPGMGRTIVPNLTGLTARGALVEARKRHLDAAMTGSGVVVSQNPAAGAVVAVGDRISAELASPSHDPTDPPLEGEALVTAAATVGGAP